jgi:hypothetical protein
MLKSIFVGLCVLAALLIFAGGGVAQSTDLMVTAGKVGGGTAVSLVAGIKSFMTSVGTITTPTAPPATPTPKPTGPLAKPGH